ncbi:MAG: hypothetical protein IIA63_12330 [Nitrospinae bacterium]|nr:hypothetical protein [Nitrospinota bacterium]
MKTPRTVSNKGRVITLLILWNIFFWVWLIAWLFFLGSFDSVFADEAPQSTVDPPPVPPIAEHVRWEINQIPANLTLVWANGLQVAFPMMPSTGFTYEETVKEEGGLWYFRAPCTSAQKIIQREATAYRWGDDQDWIMSVHKTSRH